MFERDIFFAWCTLTISESNFFLNKFSCHLYYLTPDKTELPSRGPHTWGHWCLFWCGIQSAWPKSMCLLWRYVFLTFSAEFDETVIDVFTVYSYTNNNIIMNNNFSIFERNIFSLWLICSKGVAEYTEKGYSSTKTINEYSNFILWCKMYKDMKKGIGWTVYWPLHYIFYCALLIYS